MKGEGGYCSGTGVCDPKGVHKSQKLSGVIIVKEYFPINGFGPFRITRYNFYPHGVQAGDDAGHRIHEFPFFKGDACFMGKEDRFFVLDAEGFFYPLECLPGRNIEGGNDFVRNCQHGRGGKVKTAFGKRVVMASLNAWNKSRAWPGPGHHCRLRP